MAGVVNIETLYERIKYFLDRVLPVAEEYKVRLGNHIADPPLPVGYRGITRWNSPEIVAGIRRYAELSKSPSHGFHLCLGSTAEGLKNPRTEILGVVEYLGTRNQIVNVHMRNIKGGLGNFQEVYVDNGDMNFIEVMRALHRVGYDGMVMPDHIPQHSDAAGQRPGVRVLVRLLPRDHPDARDGERVSRRARRSRGRTAKTRPNELARLRTSSLDLSQPRPSVRRRRRGCRRIHWRRYRRCRSGEGRSWQG